MRGSQMGSNYSRGGRFNALGVAFVGPAFGAYRRHLAGEYPPRYRRRAGEAHETRMETTEPEILPVKRSDRVFCVHVDVIPLDIPKIHSFTPLNTFVASLFYFLAEAEAEIVEMG